MKYLKWILVSIIIILISSCGTSDQQHEEVSRRLLQFYSSETESRLGIMNEPIPKYSVKTGKRIHPNTFLRLKALPNSSSPLVQNAQVKATPEFRMNYCREVLARHFPGISCEEEGSTTWGSIERNDEPEDLVAGWVSTVETSLDKIPSAGSVAVTPWSDDYWQIRYGATSYRYASQSTFSDYFAAIGSYAQPAEWDDGLSKLGLDELAKKAADWSPAEKYDLIVGDRDFGLTNEQKKEGERLLGSGGDVESWMGICHGWAAAAMMVPAPMKPVSLTGTEGINVKWFPHDVRAMASLAWANGNVRNNYVGGRCNTREPELYPNDRVKQQDCFDNNPATFHLALGNQIGRAKASFVMDVAFDYEVWNQPLQSYRFTYFNPLSPEKKGDKWSEMVVPYDAAFKAKDRFQTPLTRGKKVDAIVGVLAEVVYVAESRPSHAVRPSEDVLVKATYQYDLELEKRGSTYVPTGGEWHTNYHPDFLWVPQKGMVAEMRIDGTPLDFSGHRVPSQTVTETAADASQSGYPLCQVLSILVNESSEGRTKYVCAK